jgi:CTP synthase
MARFIFVTGGVVSSLGKGITGASLAALLQARGYTVRLRKLDPYLNVDPGTMSPFQHGEVFVTDDGVETDLDLGHYERFTGVLARKNDYITTGQVYAELLKRERMGEYLGATVQVIPHVTDMIKNFICADSDDIDFVLCEIGGTVGDIEGLPFIEAIRQLRIELGTERTLFVHLTLLPYIASAQELKTKPTQHSVKELLSMGIQPDILVCRSERPIDREARRKISLFCNLQESAVIPALDVDTIYAVPGLYHQAGFDIQVLRHFRLPIDQDLDLKAWRTVVERIRHPHFSVNIAIVGKYTSFLDAYKSLVEALRHGGIANDAHVELKWVDSEELTESNVASYLKDMDGILVPGGFGERGADGKIEAIRYARENKIPFLGICYGMQLAIVEYARHVLNLKGAGSTEHGPCQEPVVALLEEWVKEGQVEKRSAGGNLGGTMRLGVYPCMIKPDTLAFSVYGAESIEERHRHRYEVNSTYIPQFEAKGLKFSGMSPDGVLPEMIELPENPWFMGVQFHPELRSRPFVPHPLFTAFVRAGMDHHEKQGSNT